MQQPNLRELAARVTERQPVVLEADRRRAFIAARETAPLADFQAALVLGRLVICANCAGFEVGSQPAPLGHCRRFATEAWPFAPFTCGGFAVSPTAAAPAYLPDPDGARSEAREPMRHPEPRRTPSSTTGEP